MRARRAPLNERMMEADAFFREFGALDDGVYAEGEIGSKHNELMGLAISVTTRRDECVLYHFDGCREHGASRKEIVEAIKAGVVALALSPSRPPASHSRRWRARVSSAPLATP
jgi:AhpD family alkylhydroperoxidase